MPKLRVAQALTALGLVTVLVFTYLLAGWIVCGLVAGLVVSAAGLLAVNVEDKPTRQARPIERVRR